MAFGAFLEFVRMNLAGQTGIRVDAGWCTQAQALNGFGEFAPPDFVLREDEAADMLPLVATLLGHSMPPSPQRAEPETPYGLDDIYDAELEELVAEVYQRDYMMFGFTTWRS